MKNNGNSKNYTRKRLNSIILILAFTAVMAIISTYAWFSSQKNVTIKNLKGTVTVADGLEISLNAKDWLQELDLGSVDLKADAYNDNTNNVPTEFQPVSSDCGILENAKDLTFYKGTLHNSVNLNSVVACDLEETDESEATYPGYYAFDIFLKNTTNGAVEGAKDALQLNYDSYVKVLQSGDGIEGEPDSDEYKQALAALIAQRESTGLQNTVRVGLALYQGTAGIMDGQEEILQKTVTGAQGILDSTAIWEPNAAAHIDSVLTAYNGDKPATPITTATGSLTFQAETIVTTWALKTKAQASASLTNIYNWVTTNGDLAEQIALRTNANGDYTIGTGVSQLITSTVATTTPTWNKAVAASSATTSGAGDEDINKADNKNTNFSIPANAVCRMRVYVWLEGQDVDCLSIASHGGGVEVNLDIMKDGELGSTSDGGTVAPTATPGE